MDSMRAAALQQIQRMTAQQRQQQQEPKYRELLRITGQVVLINANIFARSDGGKLLV
jgi:hypothetical protein